MPVVNRQQMDLSVGYSQDLNEFGKVLVDHKLECDNELNFINEIEHVHFSSDEFAR